MAEGKSAHSCATERTAFIHLSQGKVAIVDERDFDYLSQWSWSYDGHAYAVRKITVNGRSTSRLMHREIAERMGLDIAGLRVDHRDQNGLNNVRLNLRVASQSQNMRNRGKPSNNTSGFKGVTWDKARVRWRASIKVGYRLILLGRFDNPILAALAYDAAAIEHHGEFAFTNFPPLTDEIRSSVAYVWSAEVVKLIGGAA